MIVAKENKIGGGLLPDTERRAVSTARHLCICTKEIVDKNVHQPGIGGITQAQV
ncbi:MAG: hypothetical protein HPM95_11850 [Alphaproteobacteria bacterium]|nr:hypothetical protein [Alphaproteobacteria bacterium]